MENDLSKFPELFMIALELSEETIENEGNSQSEPISTVSEPRLDKDEVEYDPAVQPIPPRYSYVEDLYMYTNMAIQYYNLHQDDPIELVDPLCLTSFVTSDWRDGQIRHLSFIARTKKSPSQLRLFFCRIWREYGCQELLTPTEPGNPLVQIGCGVCHPYGVVYHPFAKYHWWSGLGGSRRLGTRNASAKRFFSEAYTIKSTVKDLGIKDAYEFESTIYGHASKALEKFNFEKNAIYELLELVSCTRLVCETVPFGGIFWAHLTFIAEVNDSTNTDVHFFAEVGFDVDMVTTCIDGDSDGDSAKCSICQDVCPMFHPSRFVVGRYGGTYADSLYKGNFRGVKSELLPKDDAASLTARHEYYKSLECVDGQCASSS